MTQEMTQETYEFISWIKNLAHEYGLAFVDMCGESGGCIYVSIKSEDTNQRNENFIKIGIKNGDITNSNCVFYYCKPCIKQVSTVHAVKVDGHFKSHRKIKNVIEAETFPTYLIMNTFEFDRTGIPIDFIKQRVTDAFEEYRFVSEQHVKEEKKRKLLELGKNEFDE